MTPIQRHHTTDVLGAPHQWDSAEHGPCAGLPVTRDHGVYYSYWRPTWRERIGVMLGRPVRLCVAADSHPPVTLDTEE